MNFLFFCSKVIFSLSATDIFHNQAFSSSSSPQRRQMKNRRFFSFWDPHICFDKSNRTFYVYLWKILWNEVLDIKLNQILMHSNVFVSIKLSIKTMFGFGVKLIVGQSYLIENWWNSLTKWRQLSSELRSFWQNIIHRLLK